MGRRVRERVDKLEQGREAYARRAWLEAYDLLAARTSSRLSRRRISTCSRPAPSCSAATTSRSRGSSARTSGILEDGRDAPRGSLCGVDRHEPRVRGEIGPATGWLGRAQRLLEPEGECAERGYLLLPVVFRHEAAGDFAAAAAVAGEAVRIAERFGDRDLFALAIQGQGYMLIKDGRVREGLALLDEAMVAVTAEELSPIVTGIVYCGVILACQEVYEVRRAREWTRALADWWALQPEMVAFTGRCLVHRAEVLQLDGSWRDALDEARRAGERFVETKNPAAGLARYRQGELLRLQGEFAAAEQAYREASRFGWEPQPGLAQLRLAQGRARRGRGRDPPGGGGDHAAARARAAPSGVRGDHARGRRGRDRAPRVPRARGARDAFTRARCWQRWSPMREGAVHLADGDAQAALVALRQRG